MPIVMRKLALERRTSTTSIFILAHFLRSDPRARGLVFAAGDKPAAIRADTRRKHRSIVSRLIRAAGHQPVVIRTDTHHVDLALMAA
jgi:hypothetical protein